jgi:hypothetical protein
MAPREPSEGRRPPCRATGDSGPSETKYCRVSEAGLAKGCWGALLLLGKVQLSESAAVLPMTEVTDGEGAVRA